MQVKEITNTEFQAKYNITVSVLDLNIVKQEELTKIASSVNLQGFRPGKAPINMVELQYRSKVMTAVLDRVVNDSVNKLIKDKKLDIFGTPKVNIVEYTDNSNLVFEVEIDIMPTVKDIDFSKIKLNKNIITLSDSELNKALQDIANSNKAFADITEKRPTQLGDVAVIDFLGKVDNVAFSGGEGKDYALELGSASFIPGFEEQLVNKNVGDEVAVKVKFPAEYQVKELADKDAVFEVTIKKIQSATAAEVNDELAKKIGIETLDELKEKIQLQHTSQLDTLEKNKLKTLLVEELIKLAKLKIPANILEEQKTHLWNEYVHKKEHMKMHDKKSDHAAHGHTEEEIAYYNKPEAEVKAELEEQSTKSISLSLIFNDIATKNLIKLDNKDIMSVVAEEAKMYGMDPQVLFSNYQKNPDFIKQLQVKAMEGKVFDFILSKVSYNENKVTFEDYLKQLSIPSNK